MVAFPQLGVDRFPNMDLPQIYVRTAYVGAAAEEVESEVSSVIEDAVATVAGIDELRSISRDGRSFVIITFNSIATSMRRLRMCATRWPASPTGCRPESIRRWCRSRTSIPRRS